MVCIASQLMSNRSKPVFGNDLKNFSEIHNRHIYINYNRKGRFCDHLFTMLSNAQTRPNVQGYLV